MDGLEGAEGLGISVFAADRAADASSEPCAADPLAALVRSVLDAPHSMDRCLLRSSAVVGEEEAEGVLRDGVLASLCRAHCSPPAVLIPGLLAALCRARSEEVQACVFACLCETVRVCGGDPVRSRGLWQAWDFCALLASIGWRSAPVAVSAPAERAPEPCVPPVCRYVLQLHALVLDIWYAAAVVMVGDGRAAGRGWTATRCGTPSSGPC